MRVKTKRCRGLLLALLVEGWLIPSEAFCANFTRGTETAQLYGTHEIVLTGNGSVSNPFNTVAQVTFTPPSGIQNAVTVYAFYDGGNTWRARVYVTETGTWRWNSSSSDPLLDNQSRSFEAASTLAHPRGMLKKHRDNPKRWMTHDGRTFLHLSDTAYRFFNPAQTRWQAYARDNVTMGINAMRCMALGEWDWNLYWSNAGRTRYNLSSFQTTDARLQWLLDNVPSLYDQMIFFPDVDPYGTDDAFWTSLPSSVRQGTLRYLIARWAAFPQVYWLILNDSSYDSSHPHNLASVREAGQYVLTSDPWGHLMSTGPIRGQTYYFTSPSDLNWSSYIHLEDFYSLSAEEVSLYASVPVHVFLGEDYYEQSARGATDNPRNPRYFYRRLFWAWLLSGGSVNYGGRYAEIHPYTQTGSLTYVSGDYTYTAALTGLDSIPYIQSYFNNRGIDLAYFQPDDAVATDLDGETGSARPQAARRGTEEYLIYHPNAQPGESLEDNSRSLRQTRRDATLASKQARMRVDLTSATGAFEVEWFRVQDGVSALRSPVNGGRRLDFTAPWSGYDVVLRLYRPNVGTGIVGDANGDGTFDLADVNQVIKWIVGFSPFPAVGDPRWVGADVNCDGEVDLADVNWMIKALQGIASFPC